MIDLLTALIDLEEDPALHASRLLVLLNTFRGKNESRMKGLTKLVKLDFLLRYPVYLERALKARDAQSTSKSLNIKEYERKSVESSMIRYRYGPWDHRYRAFINYLVAKGLAEVEVQTIPRQKTIFVELTSKGKEMAMQLECSKDFEDIAIRSKVLKRHFDKNAMWLERFIYDTFPEIASMKMGETIV
jgi:hypothetical protein